MTRFVQVMIAAIPSVLIRHLGRLQFRYPWLGSIIRKLAKSALNGEGVIQRGIGKGLKFDATAGFPGMIVGTTEPLEQMTLSRYLKPGGVFYDIGANIGFYATLAGRLVGPAGRVYAFEPHPETASRCRANVRRNGFGHVEVVVAAVAASDGVTRLAMDQGSTENAIRSGSVAGANELLVDLVSIDGWRESSGALLPSVVMIDAEGQELEVLKGMRRTIEAAKPTLLIEVHWLGEAFETFVMSEPALADYRFTTYDEKPLRREICRYHALGGPA